MAHGKTLLELLLYPFQIKGNIAPNLTFKLSLQQGFSETYQCARSHCSPSPCVQSCTRCRPSNVRAGQTPTLVRSAPWSCTESSVPVSEADEGGAAGAQSWAGEPRRSEMQRPICGGIVTENRREKVNPSALLYLDTLWVYIHCIYTAEHHSLNKLCSNKFVCHYFGSNRHTGRQ